MRSKDKVAISKRMESVLYQPVNGKHTAFGFAHLGIVNIKELAVNPVIHPLMPERAFRLGNFISMMHRNMIHSAAVNIHPLAQVFHRHCRALNMPAGEAHTERRIPLHNLIRILALRKPQDEVRLITLVFILVHTRFFVVVQLQPCEVPVARKLCHIKVDVALRFIREALLQKRGYKVNHLGYMLGRPRHHIGALNHQFF